MRYRYIVLCCVAMIMAGVGVSRAQQYQLTERFFIATFDDSKGERLESPKTESRPTRERLPIAIKTNLMLDIVGALNLEVELPIEQRWSLAAELVFPWWTMASSSSDSKRNRMQILSGTIEARYWWRRDEPLTGWFAALYAGLGRYDLERKGSGVQGDLVVSSGVGGGYAHPISRARNLRLEYSLGVGYLSTYYHRYNAQYCDNNVWHAVVSHEGRYSWWGLTRAKISLVWMVNSNANR